ncbi:hypothetical protein Tco_1494565 [Tanacetum coccineum]
MYLRLFAAGRKSGDLISGGQLIARLVKHFGLLTEERLRGITIIALALSVIDMAELPYVAAGAHEAAEDALAVDDDMPQVIPPPPRTQGERIALLEEEVHGMRELLQGQSEIAGVAYTSYSETLGEYQIRIRRRTDSASTSIAQQDQQQPDP